MIIKPVPHGLEDLVGKSPGGRTQGLHASDIYGRYFDGKKKKRSKADDAKFAEAMPLYFEAGLSWEQMLEEQFKKRMSVNRPGELVTPEGIIYSPDLFLFNEGGVDFRLGEMKLTWMSNREMPREAFNDYTFPEKYAKWDFQMQYYCFQLETPYARLISFFINGDYRENRQPQLQAWDICYSPRELRNTNDLAIRIAKAEGML